MILNPSHEITLRGLPSEVLDAYVRYKKGSRAIVSWLVQFGPARYKGVKTLPIKDLASLAASVVDGIKELPDTIHFHFKETIAARKRLSQYFRTSIDHSQDDDDTINHEHFTASLTKIYSSLCSHCCARSDHSNARADILFQTTLAEPIRNHYACLPVESCDELETIASADNSCGECQYRTSNQCPDLNTNLEIENDEMSVAIETAAMLESMYDTLMVVSSAWEKAGHGEAHFVAAAGVTNTAWSMLQERETQLRNDHEEFNLTVLHQRCCVFKNTTADSAGALAKVHVLLESLQEAERAVVRYRDSHKLTMMARCPSCVQKPGDYIQTESSSSPERTISFALALMDNILHLMTGTRPSPIILQSSPIFAEIGFLLTHRDEKTTSFRCTLGIHLLTTTYTAYLSTLPKPSLTSMCRISALKLSRQAYTHLDAILSNKDSFPCCCPQTLAFHLSNLQTAMDVYSKYKCWDLYFQSPWISGNHIIEMLDTLAYYGMRLFHYRHYVGSVLHSYNVLVHLAALEPIPPLEQLCETFKDVFFPAGRPAMHFKNSWARYIGARLKFKKGHKRHGDDKDSWCMAVPAHAAKSSAGFGIDATERGKCQLETKFDYAKIDPLIRLKQMGWRADTSTLDHTLQHRKSGSSSLPSRLDTLSRGSDQTPARLQPDDGGHHIPSSTHPLSTQLDTLTASLTPPTPSASTHNTTPPLPTTTLSHLSIFHTMTTLIDTMTRKIHTDPRDIDCELCICFAHTLLSGADRIVEGRKFGGVECWRKEEKRVAEIVKDCLIGVFGDGGGERLRKQWTWEV